MREFYSKTLRDVPLFGISRGVKNCKKCCIVLLALNRAGGIITIPT